MHMKKPLLHMLRKSCNCIAIALIVLCIFNSFGIEYSYAGTDSPFRILKVGTKNITNYANDVCFLYEEMFDGGIDIWMGKIEGAIKRGSKVRIKIKKGYKYEMDYICGNIRKTIRNNFRIPTSENNWYIDLRIKKGLRTGYFWLLPDHFRETMINN